MEQDLFAYLPSETIIDIFSRLSVRTIAVSKCVCKPWLDLLESDDFVNSYHSKSAAALALSTAVTRGSNPCKVFELDDKLDVLESQNPITKFDFPREAALEGSANGFLFLRDFWFDAAVYVCNPITREFIELSFFEESAYSRRIAYGFGTSKLSGEHKVVRIKFGSSYCHVYTLGTGRWRHVEATSDSDCFAPHGVSFVDGNLYWKVSHSKSKTWFCSSFDLEAERLSTISAPPIRVGLYNFHLVTSRDCLYAVDDSTKDEIVLWLLNECGAEKSWKKEYVIDPHPDYHEVGFDVVEPIKVFQNGDILMLYDGRTLFCYSVKTKTYQEIQLLDTRGDYFAKSFLFTPSFRSLKRSFGTENVISFDCLHFKC